MQDILTPGNYLLAPLALYIFIHNAAQFRFACLKSLPGLPGPLQKAGLKPGQGEALAAALDEFHGVGITRPGFQGLLEVAEGRALLVQIVVGVGDTEIPEVVPFKIVLVGLQKVQGLSEEGFVLQPGNVVVGPGQLAVHFGGGTFSGDGLQCVNDPLILIVLIPKLALLQ